jgi:hypothetical protein
MGRPRTRMPRMPKRPPEGAELVRCLGPGPEHQFYTRHKQTQRVCGYCRQVQDKLVLSPIALRAQKSPYPEDD